MRPEEACPYLFFQAEDGIRDHCVTGVQTCALPIYRLARATMAGHLLECGAQVTGGYFADPGFKDVPGLENVGFPIADIAPDASCVIGKADGTGGLVTERTVKEQLLYEVHDPAAYLTPDVTADISEA